MKILSCNSNRPLAEAIAAYLDVSLTKADVKRFADMEVFVEIGENVRGEDVFVIQSTCFPANDNVMELLVALDALRRGSASRYRGASLLRLCKAGPQIRPANADFGKLLANLITSAGADRVLTIDLHAGQIQGFFDIPTDNLFAAPVFIEDIRSRYDNGQVMIVSPDVGGVVRARSLARRLDADLAIIDKRRPKAGVSEVMNIIGDVSDRHCIMVDDIVDSGGTLCNAAQALIDAGALSVDAYVTHGVLSRRGQPRRGIAAEFAGDDRFDSSDRSGQGGTQYPPYLGCAAAWRSDPPDQ